MKKLEANILTGSDWRDCQKSGASQQSVPEAVIDCVHSCSLPLQPFSGKRRKREFNRSQMSACSVQHKLFSSRVAAVEHSDLWTGSVPVPSTDINDRSKDIVATGTSGAATKNRVPRN